MQSARVQRIATIVGTFSVALAIGFVMQNGDAFASRLGVNDNPDDLGAEVDGFYRPVTASGMMQSYNNEAMPTTDPLMHNMSVPANDDGAAAGCEIQFEAVPDVAATVRLHLSAPCQPEALVTVQHQGMKFIEMTDAAGRLVVQVPALATEAYFVATVENQASVVAITGVQDLVYYDRAVLQWSGYAALALQASGEDAYAQDADPIAKGNPSSEHGFLTRLGADQNTEPLMVEIYTFPSGNNQADGDIALSVHAYVTADNCGQKVYAQSIQLQPSQPPAAQSMSLMMPDCDQIGEYLELKNLFEDLTLASR